MKRFTVCAMVAVMMVLAGGARAEGTNAGPKLRLTLQLVDGSRIVGTPAIAALPLQTTYAKMDIPLDQVLTVKMADDHENAVIELRNGDKLKGVVSLPPLALETLFGKTAIGIEHIRQIDAVLLGANRANLVLWNQLGSEAEVKNSRVGPAGALNGGRFVPGRFGQGIELTMQEQYGVAFPADILPGPDGCIEFWAKLAEFPADIRQPGGAWPSLIAACDGSGAQAFLMHFCANDGVFSGGLCFQGAGNGGTGGNGSWTYAGALRSDTADAWHHYALVWAAGGIPGVDNGKRTAAVFVDGKLNTGFWNGAGAPMAIPKTWRFGLLAHQGTPSGRIVFDNLKIWKTAKTDFSDRTDE